MLRTLIREAISSKVVLSLLHRCIVNSTEHTTVEWPICMARSSLISFRDETYFVDVKSAFSTCSPIRRTSLPIFSLHLLQDALPDFAFSMVYVAM